MAEHRGNDAYAHSRLKILWIQVKQIICAHPFLCGLGAMHCFMLVKLENNQLLKIDRDATEYYVKKATPEQEGARTVVEMLDIGGSLQIREIYEWLRRYIQSKYHPLENNCFDFVKNIVRKFRRKIKVVDEGVIARIEAANSNTQRNVIEHTIARGVNSLWQYYDNFIRLVSKAKRQVMGKYWPQFATVLKQFVQHEFPRAVEKCLEGLQLLRDNYSVIIVEVRQMINMSVPVQVQDAIRKSWDIACELIQTGANSVSTQRWYQSLSEIVSTVEQNASQKASQIQSYCVSKLKIIGERLNSNLPTLVDKASDFLAKTSQSIETAVEKLRPAAEHLFLYLPWYISLTTNIIQEYRELPKYRGHWRKAAGNVTVRTAVDMAIFYMTPAFMAIFATIGRMIGGWLGMWLTGWVAGAVQTACVCATSTVGLVVVIAVAILLPNKFKQWMPWNR